MVVGRLGRVVIALALAVAACGPSDSEQAAERLDAAWAAAEGLDPVRAAAELEAAERLSPETVDAVRDALEARIAAVEAWVAAETAFEAGDFLTAIDGYRAAAEAYTFFASRSRERIAASEDAFVAPVLEGIARAVSAEGPEAADEAFGLLSGGLEVFPENASLLQVRQDVAAVYFPIVAADVEEQLGLGAPEEADERLRAALAILGDDVPGAADVAARVDVAIAEAEEARRIAEQQERERVAAEQRAAREAAERERQQVYARIGCVRDDLERITRCYDEATYTRIPTNRLYLWTFQADGERPRLQLGLQTRGSRWIFWERARVYVGGRTWTVDAGYFNVIRDNSAGSTWETYSRRVTSADLDMAAAIADSREAVVRFIDGDGRYREHRLTSAQIQAVGNMLAYWAEIE